MQVAWLFNIRGSDILFNPVAIAAALLTQEEAFLFIDAAKLGEDVQQVKRGRGGERKGRSLCMSTTAYSLASFPTHAFSDKYQRCAKVLARTSQCTAVVDCVRISLEQVPLRVRDEL